MFVTLILSALILLGFTGELAAQADLNRSVDSWRRQHELRLLREFVEFLSMPNVADNLDDVRRNADWILSEFRKRDIPARLLTLPGVPPVVYAEWRTKNARRTVMLYAHYDGQPVVPENWASDPWKPVLRSGPPGSEAREIDPAALQGNPDPQWRLYARSAGDDKMAIIGMFAAIDAMRAAGIEPSVNVKFFFEGEEEAGSPNLAEILRANKELLTADAWLLCDGPVHQSRTMQLYFGARGITGMEMTTYGPARPLHSGHYGNWAPNPISELIDLMSRMRNSEGEILIPDFFADVVPISAAERQALNSAPNQEQALMHELALGRREGKGKRLEELIMLPAINFKGIRSGNVGAKARNAIQTSATASIGFRLVPNQTPTSVRTRVESFLRGLGYHIVYEQPDAETRRAHPRLVRLKWGGGYPPARTSLDHPLAQALITVVEQARGKVITIPTTGGSIPMYLFQDILEAPVVVVPIANHDNNQHAEDENIRLQNLWDGIRVYAAIMAGLGKHWQ